MQRCYLCGLFLCFIDYPSSMCDTDYSFIFNIGFVIVAIAFCRVRCPYNSCKKICMYSAICYCEDSVYGSCKCLGQGMICVILFLPTLHFASNVSSHSRLNNKTLLNCRFTNSSSYSKQHLFCLFLQARNGVGPNTGRTVCFLCWYVIWFSLK